MREVSVRLERLMRETYNHNCTDPRTVLETWSAAIRTKYLSSNIHLTSRNMDVASVQLAAVVTGLGKTVSALRAGQTALEVSMNLLLANQEALLHHLQVLPANAGPAAGSKRQRCESGVASSSAPLADPLLANPPPPTNPPPLGNALNLLMPYSEMKKNVPVDFTMNAVTHWELSLQAAPGDPKHVQYISSQAKAELAFCKKVVNCMATGAEKALFSKAATATAEQRDNVLLLLNKLLGAWLLQAYKAADLKVPTKVDKPSASHKTFPVTCSLLKTFHDAMTRNKKVEKLNKLVQVETMQGFRKSQMSAGEGGV